MVAPTLALLITPRRTAAQGSCRTDTLTAIFPAAWLGQRVSQIVVVPANVAAPAGVAGLVLRAVHATTRPTVILNDTGIEAGAPVDSLAVQESVRRLRMSGLFNDVELTGVSCPGEGVALTYRTRDVWSLRADARFGRRQSRVAVSDINILGTGRSLGVQTDELDDRRATNLFYVDPWLLNSPFRGTGLLRNYGDGRLWAWSVRTRNVTPIDRWRVLLTTTQLHRVGVDSVQGTRTDLDRRAFSLLFARAVAQTASGVWVVQAGGEQEHADLDVARLTRQLGKPEVHRFFTVPVVGVARRSLTYAALDWLVPGQTLAELPTGVEADAIVGYGPEVETGKPITHLDGWVGATYMPDPGTIVTGDVWLGGYWNSDSVSNGSARVALNVYRRAWRGLWALRFTDERIYNPDPDVFALTTLDPLLRSLQPSSRLSEQASSATLERAFTVYSSSGIWAMQVAPFVTVSERHNTVSDNAQPQLDTRGAVFGIGLRRVFAQPTQTPLRIDVGRGFYRSSTIPDRWVAVVTASPWLNALRGRTGAREMR